MARFAFATVVTATFIALALGGCAGAAEEAETSASTEESLVSAKEPAIEADVTWRLAVTGTPTYGFDATEPFLTIKVVVDDAALAKKHPGVDGLERPFALVPRDAGHGVTWQRVELSYRGASLRGYYATRSVDTYEAAGIKLSALDLEVAKRVGVAIGLDTNVGTIWAQDAGQNFLALRQADR